MDVKPRPGGDAAAGPTVVTRATGVVVAGHGVASGAKGDPRFPGGTLAMQIPHFAMQGIDLSRCHQGTLNLDVSPWRLVTDSPAVTIRDLRWHPTEPAEDFSFLDCVIEPTDLGAAGPAAEAVRALIYWPHPATKPEHVQPPTVVEVLAPRLSWAASESRIDILIAAGQGHFVRV